MQSVHTNRYMIRNLRGHYVKTSTDEGIGYVMFKGKKQAQTWADSYATEDCFVVKVRAAITPIDSGRTERLVAFRQARATQVPEAQQTEFNF